MRIMILAVGKIKEKFYKDALEEYKKRLGRYCNLEVTEVADEKTEENATEREIEIVLEREAQRLLKHIREEDYCIALDIRGKKLDSVAFSKKIEQLEIEGRSRVAFVIGGSLGLHTLLLKRAQERLSFSDMTFPHQLMRVILTEQIYRGYRIMRGEPYHK